MGWRKRRTTPEDGDSEQGLRRPDREKCAECGGGSEGRHLKTAILSRDSGPSAPRRDVMTTTRTHIESTNGTRAAGGESSMHARAFGASRASWPAGVEGGASRLPGCGAANGVLDAHLPGACRKDRVAHA